VRGGEMFPVLHLCSCVDSISFVCASGIVGSGLVGDVVIVVIGRNLVSFVLASCRIRMVGALCGVSDTGTVHN
jgi:hypothetical protein